MDFYINEYPKDEFFGENSDVGSSLGIITKSYVSSITLGVNRDINFQQSIFIAERLSLQEIACSILNDRKIVKKKTGSFSVYKWRVNYCLRSRVNALEPVSVRFNPNRQKAHYHNLQRCGSVWTCPFCAVQVSEGRRQELKFAMDSWQKQNGFVYLLTLTNRHHQWDTLSDLMTGQKKALKRLWENTALRKILKNLGYQGRITSLEVTYGSNGWHPHQHILLFFRQQINVQSLRSLFAVTWQRVCLMSGLKSPTIEHGVDLQEGDKASDYVAKWGLSDEMTKSHVKKGKNDSLTPFDFLRRIDENPKYKALFREFAECFHGKSQLVWSAGLKELLLVKDTTDEELATKTEGDSIEIKQIAIQIWNLVLRNKIRADFLRACELDYLENMRFDRVANLVMMYAVLEQERLNALDSS